MLLSTLKRTNAVAKECLYRQSSPFTIYSVSYQAVERELENGFLSPSLTVMSKLFIKLHISKNNRSPRKKVTFAV